MRRSAARLIQHFTMAVESLDWPCTSAPAQCRARDKARQSSCLNNVKQLMLGVMMYTQDYDEMLIAGAFPIETPTRRCYDVLEPYLNNIQMLQCPNMPGGLVDYGWNYQEFGYYYAVPGTGWATKLAEVPRPAETILLGDNGVQGSSTHAYIYRRGTSAQLCTRHNGSGNYGFCDGHAKWLPFDEVAKRVTGVAAPWRFAP